MVFHMLKISPVGTQSAMMMLSALGSSRFDSVVPLLGGTARVVSSSQL
jgi:hypothetical protein